VTNGLILRRTPFKRLFVTPAAGDSGIALGAALYGHHRLVGRRPRWPRYNDYLGRDYTSDEVGAALAACRHLLLNVEEVPEPSSAAADDVADGLFVGWFEGGSEFGPRALGHRSILCDPRPPDMKDRLNAVVKFREPFRPYAASVLSERVHDYFDVVADDPFMMTVAQVRDSVADGIASVCHVDGTCRIQTVSPDQPGGYRRLIEHFFERTGVPLVLNTSYNVRGEPIVESPDDALRCFLSCNLDVLYLNGRRVRKLDLRNMPAPATAVPHINEGITIGSTVPTVDGRAAEAGYFCRTRTGFRTPVNASAFSLLVSVDARRTIAEIAELGGLTAEEALATMRDLQWRGLISVASGVRAIRPTPN